MASLHFRTASPAALESLLKIMESEFAAAPAPDEQTRNQLGLLGSLLQRNMDEAADDPAVRAIQQVQLRQLAGNMSLQSSASGEKAALVQQGEFVSLYWGDHIRTDNLDEQTRRYAALTNLPVLGIGVYEGCNLTLCAVSGYQECSAYYWFEEDEVQPGDGAELCRVLGLPEENAAALDTAFDAQTLEELTAKLENTLGILFACGPFVPQGKAPAVQWPGANYYGE